MSQSQESLIKFVELNRIAIVQRKVQSAKKSADICIEHHMKGEVMQLLDALDAKLEAMAKSTLSAMREAA